VIYEFYKNTKLIQFFAIKILGEILIKVFKEFNAEEFTFQISITIDKVIKISTIGQ